jgi:hypothetical protein
VATGVVSDGCIKHDPLARRNWLAGLSFVTEVSEIGISGRNSESGYPGFAILGGSGIFDPKQINREGRLGTRQ